MYCGAEVTESSTNKQHHLSERTNKRHHHQAGETQEKGGRVSTEEGVRGS
jgi:hypothetical protein